MGADPFTKVVYAIDKTSGQFEFCPEVFAENVGEFVELDGEAFVGFEACGRVAHQKVPDLGNHRAGDGDDGDVALAFAGEEFPAPWPERGLAAHAQNGVGTLNEEVAHVFAAAAADAEFDQFAASALALAGVEADVGDELGGSLEAPDVADDGKKGEGVDQADAEEFHATEHEGFGADLLADKAQESFAPCGVVAKGLEMIGQEIAQEGGPVALAEDPSFGGGAFEGAFAGADGKLVEVAFEGVGGGGVVGVVGDGVVIGVEKFAALAGESLWLPNAGGVCLEIDQRDAGGGELVVVGVGFGVFFCRRGSFP